MRHYALRVRRMRYRLRTAKTSVYCVVRSYDFTNFDIPGKWGVCRSRRFLRLGAATREVSVSNHKRTLSPLLLLYSKVLGYDLLRMNEIARPFPEATVAGSGPRAVVGQSQGALQDSASSQALSTKAINVVNAGGTQSRLDHLADVAGIEPLLRRLA